MSYLDMKLKDIHEALKNGKVTSKELINESIERAKKYQDKYNSFVTIVDADPKEVTDSIISGIPYAMKDNVSTKGILTTSSSNILKDYVPVFDATIYEKLNKNSAVMMGKSVLDELAMGGTGTTGHTGVVKNPWNETHIIGGSSAGSAAAVALNIVPFAIGTDTGDSIRKPAGYGGVVGYKPTYGLVSRYGIFSFASSMDTAGTITRSVKDVAVLLDILKGKDPKDMTSYDDKCNYEQSITNDVTAKKVCYVKEFGEALKANEEAYKNYTHTIDKLKETGVSVFEVSVEKELLKSVLPAYFVISCAEATSNNSNLTGIIFGSRVDGKSADEIMINTRTEGFSEFIKRRFVLGSYILQSENQEKLFKNGQRIRRLIVDKFNELFKDYDAVIMPNGIDVAPKFDEKVDRLTDEYLILEQALAIANFGGFPSLTIPSGVVKDMPASINIMGPVKKDLDVLNIGLALEEKLEFKYLSEMRDL